MGKTKKEKEEDRLANDKRLASVQCKCTNRVPYDVFNKKGWAVCNICGSKVLKPRDVFKKKIKEMLEVE